MGEIIDLRSRIKVVPAARVVEDLSYSEAHFKQRELPLKKKNGWLKGLVVIVSAVALTTVGIKASDELFGAKGEQGEGSVCPVGMVFVSSPSGGFCIDRYEASAGAGCEFQDPGDQNQTLKNIENADCQAVSDPGKGPWRFISQNQAASVCAKAGKRLPTSEEWARASLGTPDKSGQWKADDCQVSNNWDKQPGLAGSGKSCVSGSGAYDMIGNVWEWVEGVAVDGQVDGAALPTEGYVKGVNTAGLPTETDPELGDANYYYDYVWLKRSGTRGIARGGYWGNGAEAGQYSVYIVTEPSYAGTGVGFRCVK
jgi:formylglycine-generating enzyme required for sulfatase activity